MFRKLPRGALPWINALVTLGSLLLCTQLLLLRIPGMTILGFSPQWLLMWVIAWSVKREMIYALLGAIAAAWIHDSLMVTALPSHLPGFVVVAYFVSRWRQQRYLQEDFIILALLVFVMTLAAEVIMAFQYLLWGLGSPGMIWGELQRIGLATAILSSLWAPLLCTPLVRWWDYVRMLDRQ
ncbi:rod shape-determining protein MreD [Picosynechococcus sp. PCC 7003]|uniref:rod shape-determining protein MreD n=1 Tax=Picosynechococcus sp. PCC 7003 TaxID=374981 RepID=UPI000810CF4D|nr:rod shape-determining protein MreD [Picosynechococcus sp. PCC 7003]ANV84754.1 rod shape-determining protein MreD [Picosynechococcus sp. PCC 7003]